jgi:hypothetical protein
MASVQLTKFWVTNTLTKEMIGAYTDPKRDQSHSVKGEVRQYAGGRQRAVGSPGRASTWGVTLLDLTQAQCDQLKAWMDAAVTVLARDHRGQTMYGTFFQVDVGEYAATTFSAARYTVAISIRRVDVVEGE